MVSEGVERFDRKVEMRKQKTCVECKDVRYMFIEVCEGFVGYVLIVYYIRITPVRYVLYIPPAY